MQPQGNLIKISAASLSLVALVLVAWTVLSRASHDWDLDAFLYLGSRLAEGELLYTRDFETKLPLVQYLFYWPNLLGGIGAWKLLNFGLVSCLGYLASRRLAHELRRPRPDDDTVPDLAWYLTSLYLVVLYSLPGAESGHLEMVSASLAYLACAWLVASSRRSTPTSWRLDAASGFLVGLASLIRPNYLYLGAAMLVWMSLRVAAGGSIRAVAVREAAFIAGFAIAVAAVFLPYLVSGSASIAALEDGLRAIGAFSSGMSLGALLRAQFMGVQTGVFHAVLYLGIALGLAQRIRRRAPGQGGHGLESEMHMLALLGTLGLTASLLRNHYWVHNSTLFAPLVAMIAAVYSIQFFDWMTSRDRGIERSSRVSRCAGVATLLLLALVLPGTVLYRSNLPMSVASLRASISPHINDRNIDQRLMERLQALHDASISFLAAGYPIYHARLGEPRVGDGHPYMLLRALRGEDLPKIRGLYLFSDEVRAFPCRALTRSGKQVIVVATNDMFYPLAVQCLAVPDSGYVRLSVPGLEPFVLFARSDVRQKVDRVLDLSGRL